MGAGGLKHFYSKLPLFYKIYLVEFLPFVHKGDNFCDLFCIPVHQAPSEKWTKLKWKTIAHLGSQVIHFIEDPFSEEVYIRKGVYQFDRTASLKNVPILLKT